MNFLIAVKSGDLIIINMGCQMDENSVDTDQMTSSEAT